MNSVEVVRARVGLENQIVDLKDLVVPGRVTKVGPYTFKGWGTKNDDTAELMDPTNPSKVFSTKYRFKIGLNSGKNGVCGFYIQQDDEDGDPSGIVFTEDELDSSKLDKVNFIKTVDRLIKHARQLDRLDDEFIKRLEPIEANGLVFNKKNVSSFFEAGNYKLQLGSDNGTLILCITDTRIDETAALFEFKGWDDALRRLPSKLHRIGIGKDYGTINISLLGGSAFNAHGRNAKEFYIELKNIAKQHGFAIK